jgi:hypothetical protein
VKTLNTIPAGNRSICHPVDISSQNDCLDGWDSCCSASSRQRKATLLYGFLLPNEERKSQNVTLLKLLMIIEVVFIIYFMVDMFVPFFINKSVV